MCNYKEVLDMQSERKSKQKKLEAPQVKAIITKRKYVLKKCIICIMYYK